MCFANPVFPTLLLHRAVGADPCAAGISNPCSLLPCSSCLGFGFGWFLAPAGVLNCWVKLPAWIFPFHGAISLWWGLSACRSSSCVPSWPDPLSGLGNWKQHTQNTCLDFPYTRKLCLDTYSWLERDVRDKKKGSHNFPKSTIILILCYSSEGSWGGTAGIVLFSPPRGSCSVRHKPLSHQCPPPRDIPTKGQLLEFICA